MKTLIELYDDRPLENVLATEVFCPERTVFLCPKEIVQDKRRQQKIRDYFTHRGIETELVFLETSLLYANKVKKQLQTVAEQYPDCTLDITGGSDAALFAGGLVCAEFGIPAFTYSRKKNRFFNIHNAPFAEQLDCTLQYNVEDCFLMAGGAVRSGRVDNSILGRYLSLIDPFFALYLDHRRDWKHIVGYIQRVSQTPKDAPVTLHADGAYTVKGEHGSRISAPEEALRALEEIGMLQNLTIEPGQRVVFDFADLQVRTWLRDIGSVLELYIYKVCLDTGIFQDVRTSVIVDWEGDFKRDNVTNEIDVMATKGIIPVFISCKTCDASTEALNELSVLRDRFGGGISRAVIVTAERCRAITRHRASELGIEVIDLEDLRSGNVGGHLVSFLNRT